MPFDPVDWVDEASPLGPPASPPGTPLDNANLQAEFLRVAQYAEDYAENYVDGLLAAKTADTSFAERGILASNPAATNLTNLNALIAAVNAGTYRSVVIGEVVPINGTPNQITANDSAWFGLGMGVSGIEQVSGTSGQFWRLGQNGSGAPNRTNTIRDMSLICSNTPTAGHYALHLENTTFFQIENIFFDNVASVVQLGANAPQTVFDPLDPSSADVWQAHQGKLANFYGSYRDGGTQVRLNFAFGVDYINLSVKSGATDTSGIPCLITPIERTDADAGLTSVEAQKFLQSDFWSRGEKDNGVKIDVGNGGVRNCWWDDCEIGDWCDDAAFKIIASATATGMCRGIWVDKCYLNNSGIGRSVLINNMSTDATRPAQIVGVNIHRSRMGMVANPGAGAAVRVQKGSGGTGPIVDTSVCGNYILDKTNTVKSAAMSFAVGDFDVLNNRVYDDPETSAAAGCAKGVETTAAVTGYIISGNRGRGLTSPTTFESLFAGSTGSVGTNDSRA